jgi:hypothetical protein
MSTLTTIIFQRRFIVWLNLMLFLCSPSALFAQALFAQAPFAQAPFAQAPFAQALFAQTHPTYRPSLPLFENRIVLEAQPY